jgi:TonB-linked SusC/RagA family outer membrane protein
MNNADVITGGGGEYPTTSLLSYYVRGTYNFENRYYFSGIFRADGSSRFAEGNQWGYFPAVSAGWRISSEDFMSGSSFISNMKLNVGYGQLGNQNVGPFQYLNIYKKDAKYIIDGNNVTGTRLSSFANPDITWETTTTLNILLETAFMDDRIILDVAYFDKKTTDMLLAPVKHYTAGTVALPFANTGEMSNTGVEIELSYNNQFGDFGFNAGVNATFQQNELLKLSEGIPYLEADGDFGVSRTYVGEPIASFYGWETDGIYQNQSQIDNDPNISDDPRRATITPGDVVFVDVNGDQLVDEKDRVHIGDGNPTALLGFFLDLSFKGFSLSTVFSGTAGQELYDQMMMRGINAPETDGSDRIMLERWTGEGSTNIWPRMSTTEFNQNYRYSELGLKSGNYVRMKDVTLGYSLPESLLDKLNIGKTRVFVSGRNLLTFTSYDGTDVEETSRGNNLTRGVIFNNYPTSRTITFGLDVSF